MDKSGKIENIIKENAGLIYHTAKNFYGVSKQDLYQAGALGIMKAYENYKVNGNTKFSTYAQSYIYGEMYLVATNKEIKVSKDIRRLIKMIEKGKTMLAQELMHEPNITELASFLGLSEQDITNALMYASTIISMDEEKDEERDLHEVIAYKENISTDDKILLNDSINSLENLEKDIINARYFEDLTQSETAKKLGITQVMVSRYETRSLTKMRDYMYM